MRTFICIPTLFLLLLLSCGEKKNPEQAYKRATADLKPAAYSFELLMFDTINKTDGEGMKQGKWIVRKLPGHIVIEAGKYKDNQKQGYWTRNNQKGEFMDSIFYENDIPKNYK